MPQDVPDLDRRLTEIQSQINRLSLSLHLWRERQDRLQPAEQRLSQLNAECSEIIERWSATGERQAQAVDRLEQRLKEWSAKAPLQGFPPVRVESVPSLDELIRLPSAGPSPDPLDLADTAPVDAPLIRPAPAGAITEAKAQPPSAAPRTPDALDLADTAAPESTAALPTPVGVRSAEAADALAARVESLERALSEAQEQIREGSARKSTVSAVWWIALLVVAAAAAWMFATRTVRQADAAAAGVVNARHQAEIDAAQKQVTAAREDAARQVAEAQDSARSAQAVSDVLAAPDLVRFVLASQVPGRDGTVAAQALWSRSRGFVFSGSRLPAPPPDSTYQVWLLTNETPVPAGAFLPNDDGRFTITTVPPPSVPLLTGISVTVEPKGGSEQPTGATFLAIK